MVVAIVLFVFVTVGFSAHEELPEHSNTDQCSTHQKVHDTFCECVVFLKVMCFHFSVSLRGGLVVALVVGMLEENGHPGSDETEDHDTEGNDEDGNSDFSHAGEVPFRRGQVVVERDHGNVEPVEDDTENGDDSRLLDQAGVSVTYTHCIEKAGQSHEAEHFGQEQQSVTGCKVMPVVIVSYTHGFDEEVAEENK